MHTDRYPDSTHNISSLKNHIKLAPHDVSTMKYDLKVSLLPFNLTVHATLSKNKPLHCT